jgi:hypothetical protein
MVAMTAPAATVSPAVADQAGDGAGLVGGERLLHLHRLKDDDEIALGDGHRRRLDGSTLTMVPCIGEVSALPPAAAPWRRRAGALLGLAGLAPDRWKPPTAAAEAGGQDDLEALAANLDDDALALTGVGSQPRRGAASTREGC